MPGPAKRVASKKTLFRKGKRAQTTLCPTKSVYRVLLNVQSRRRGKSREISFFFVVFLLVEERVRLVLVGGEKNNGGVRDETTDDDVLGDGNDCDEIIERQRRKSDGIDNRERANNVGREERVGIASTIESGRFTRQWGVSSGKSGTGGRLPSRLGVFETFENWRALVTHRRGRFQQRVQRWF